MEKFEKLPEDYLIKNPPAELEKRYAHLQEDRKLVEKILIDHVLTGKKPHTLEFFLTSDNRSLDFHRPNILTGSLTQSDTGEVIETLGNIAEELGFAIQASFQPNINKMVLEFKKIGSNENLQIGSFINWESQGILQFEEARRVTGFSEDKKYVFVEGTQTGIPIEQIVEK